MKPFYFINDLRTPTLPILKRTARLEIVEEIVEKLDHAPLIGNGLIVEPIQMDPQLDRIRETPSILY